MAQLKDTTILRIKHFKILQLPTIPTSYIDHIDNTIWTELHRQCTLRINETYSHNFPNGMDIPMLSSKICRLEGICATCALSTCLFIYFAYVYLSDSTLNLYIITGALFIILAMVGIVGSVYCYITLESIFEGKLYHSHSPNPENVLS